MGRKKNTPVQSGEPSGSSPETHTEIPRVAPAEETEDEAAPQVDPAKFCKLTKVNEGPQSDFVEGIRSIIEDLQEDSAVINPAEFLSCLRDDFPPHKLFHPEVLCKPDLFKKLKKLMQTIGIDLTPFEDCKKGTNTYQLAATIYGDEDYASELELAHSLIESFRSYNPVLGPLLSPRTPKEVEQDDDVESDEDSDGNDIEKMIHRAAERAGMKPDGTPKSPKPRKLNFDVDEDHRNYVRSQGNNERFEESKVTRKVHHDIAQRFKDDKNKFGGNIEDVWNKHDKLWRRITKHYELTQSEALNLFQETLKDEADDYFENDVLPHVRTYDEAAVMMNEKFNSRHQQNRVYNFLCSLKFATFVTEERGPNDALQKLSSVVTRRLPQCANVKNNPETKQQLLADALFGEPWATGPIERMQAKADPDYQGFLTDLSGALQNYLRLNPDYKPQATSGSGSAAGGMPPGIYYQGQGHYRNGGNHGHGNRRSSLRKFLFKKGHNPNVVCYNCKCKGHFAYDCPEKSYSTRRAFANKVDDICNRSKLSKQEGYRRVLLEFADDIDAAIHLSESLSTPDAANGTFLCFETDLPCADVFTTEEDNSQSDTLSSPDCDSLSGDTQQDTQGNSDGAPTPSPVNLSTGHSDQKDPATTDGDEQNGPPDWYAFLTKHAEQHGSVSKEEPSHLDF